MSAKRPQSDHAKMIAHYLAGRIPRDLYQAFCAGRAVLSGNTLHYRSGRYWRKKFISFQKREDTP